MPDGHLYLPGRSGKMLFMGYVRRTWLFLVMMGFMAPTGRAETGYVEGDVIVTFKPSASLDAANQGLGRHSLHFQKHFAELSRRRNRQTGLVRSANRNTLQLIDELKSDPSVETAEPNYLRWVGAAPNDADFTIQWSLNNTGQTVDGTAGTSGADIRFLNARHLARPGAATAIVAIIDTGVDYTHPDLAANMWVNPGENAANSLDDDANGYVNDVNGYNFIDGNADPYDSGDHGTHVAGTVAATGNNLLGVIGVDDRARIMALKVSSDGTTMDTASIISALQYATLMKSRGVNIVAINGSYGGGGFSTAERDAIQAAGNAGIIFCAAAGNNAANNNTTNEYPASYRLSNMIVVAASDQMDALASYSNYGSTTVDLAAPGTNIYSTAPMPLSAAKLQIGTTSYTVTPLSYSGNTTGITGSIVYCGLGGLASDFPAAVNGNIALIQRGTYDFSVKASNAMHAGARAVVIYNNVIGSVGTFLGTLQTAGNWIPVAALSIADGGAIRSALPKSGTLTAPLAYQYLDGTSMAAPHVSAAVALAAENFPDETVSLRIQRILSNVDAKSGLQGKVITGGRLNLQRCVDADLNGLPDWWEKAYFGRLTGSDPQADTDLDGQTDLQEFLAGTDPGDPQSVLHLLGSHADNGAGGLTFTLNWTAAAGKAYQVIYTNSLSPASWQSTLPNSRITASAGQTSLGYTDASASGSATRFYAVQPVVP